MKYLKKKKKKTYTITDLHAFAKKKGGKCLSGNFTKVKDLYKWECKCGYQWQVNFNNILYSNTWCPKCGGKLIGTIEEMQLLAKEKNGLCLSEVYTNKNTKLQWQCENRHIWWAIPDSIKNQGSWCKACFNNPTYNIDKIKQIARDRGGSCLSDTYENYSVKMKWQCEYGHIWYTAAKYILKGHWCHKCSKSLPKDLNHLIEIAKSRNGKLLSKRYKGMQANHKWECEYGHQWSAPAGAVKAGRWCHECRKITLDELNEVAKRKGGRCISKDYTSCKTPVEFICKEGHTFKLPPTNVKNKNAWCTFCKSSISEEKCRFIFESLLGKPFIKTRRILGDGLELDGYCEEAKDFKLAFEYQGEQHYVFNTHFHNNADGFIKQILIDLEKRHRCKYLRINLIVIPYSSNKNLIEFIKKELKKLNIPFDNELDLDLEMVYNSKSKLERLQEIAQSHNGELLSKHYQHYLVKLDFKCSKGHLFQSRPYELTNLGKWCKHCNRDIERQNQMEKLIKITSSNGGKCLSSNYIDNRTHLEFECKYGHQWRTSPAVILKGHWCPACSIIERRRN